MGDMKELDDDGTTHENVTDGARPTLAQIEEFIHHAASDAGPTCCEPWFAWCEQALRDAWFRGIKNWPDESFQAGPDFVSPPRDADLVQTYHIYLGGGAKEGTVFALGTGGSGSEHVKLSRRNHE